MNLLEELVARGLPPPSPEYRFHPTRRWRFDFAWPEHKLALEIEGGHWAGGRHNTGSGFVGDMEKYNTATFLGWRIIRSVPGKVLSSETIGWLEAIMSQSEK
jgi:very-short-patch-repair endonuclease